MEMEQFYKRIHQKWSYDVNCLFSGAIARIGGAQKRAGGVASAKYSIKIIQSKYKAVSSTENMN